MKLACLNKIKGVREAGVFEQNKGGFVKLACLNKIKGVREAGVFEQNNFPP